MHVRIICTVPALSRSSQYFVLPAVINMLEIISLHGKINSSSSSIVVRIELVVVVVVAVTVSCCEEFTA